MHGESDEQLSSRVAEPLRGTQALVGWYPMSMAPKDQEILVWCPGRDGLADMFSKCKWHPDAGWCVDELRWPTCWMWMPKVITWP